MLFLAPWGDGVRWYAAGRVIAPPDQATYNDLRNRGICADTAASPDGQTNASPLQGRMIAPYVDSANRILGPGSAAGISASDAVQAANKGVLDSYVGSAPAISAVSATALGSGSTRFNWTSNQTAYVTVQYGPTTGYGTTATSTVLPSGAQSFTVTGMPTGATHYLVTLVSIWGSTPDADKTVTVT